MLRIKRQLIVGALLALGVLSDCVYGIAGWGLRNPLDRQLFWTLKYSGGQSDPSKTAALCSEIVRLVGEGADLTARDEFGRTVLHFVFNPLVAKLLIKLGARPCVAYQDKDGQTPLHEAELHVIWDIIDNGDGQGPASVFRLLFECGASLFTYDNNGRTPTQGIRTYLAGPQVLAIFNLEAKYLPPEKLARLRERMHELEEIKRAYRAANPGEEWKAKIEFLGMEEIIRERLAAAQAGLEVAKNPQWKQTLQSLIQDRERVLAFMDEIKRERSMAAAEEPVAVIAEPVQKSWLERLMNYLDSFLH
jgi:hypothetical protein